MTWAKGKSGNPRGRATARARANAAFTAALRLAIARHGRGHDPFGDGLRKLAKVWIERAIAGDMQAIKMIADRLDGPA